MGKVLQGVVLFLMIVFGNEFIGHAQETDTLRGRNIYNPERLKQADTAISNVTDFEEARHRRDSIDARMQFVKDSLMARERFVKDSIIHHKLVLDSLTFLQRELQPLLDGYIRTLKDDIILRSNKISITGDTLLTDYTYVMLPFGVIDPYTPWKARMNLSDKAIRLKVDKNTGKIISVQAPFMRCTLGYGARNTIMIINEPPMVQNNWAGKFYKTPIDSVFYDKFNRVTKIKRYVQFYSLVNTNQKGTPLFLNLNLIKQFEYDQDNHLTGYREIKYCERWKPYEQNKICSTINYSLTGEHPQYQLTRRNTPANVYSDGTYTFDFDQGDNLKSVSFHNLSNTENWQRQIELNKEGNVSCYTDKTKDIVRKSLCMIYHEPNAKYPVEKITTTFEADGISYLQVNNTTGLSRTRDRMTLEWSPWK